MLLVGKVRPGGGDYYLEVAAGTGTGFEPAGRWVGRGAGQLGLDGAVERAPFQLVLAGADPARGEPLGTAGVTVAGFDLVFSAPKSVSLLYGLGDESVADAVAEAHRSAVAGALDYVERRAMAVRRSTGGMRIPEPTTGAVAAAFDHHTSRMLDPHLHTHVVVANLAADSARQWSALDGRGLYVHRRAAESLYHVQLRAELSSRLGVTWESSETGRADVAGIGAEARRVFSQRAVAIEAQLAEWLGNPADASPRARHVAWAATRPPREAVSADELRATWRARGEAVGLSERRLAAVLDRGPRALAEGELERAVAAAEGRLIAAGVAVPRRVAVAEVCRMLPSGGPAPTVEERTDELLGRWSPGGDSGVRRVGVAEGSVAPPVLELSGPGPSREREPESGRAGLAMRFGSPGDYGLGLG